MIYSIYPTDTTESIDKTIECANNFGEKIVFTSLHIPESKNLKEYMQVLKSIYEKYNINFFADISPNTLKMLDISLEQVKSLKQYGIIGCRIDYGFEKHEIIKIANLGFKIAINASTATKQLVDDLKTINVIGWHNFYPRPETGITQEFFVSQNKLFEQNNLEIYTFIPGEQFLRAPLFLGLPTLESSRYQNTYSNYLQIKALCPHTHAVIAEGAPHQKHREWIKTFEDKNITTLPVSSISKDVFEKLENQIFKIRIENSKVAFRIEGTRNLISPEEVVFINAKKRYRGSFQIDNARYGRYSGEINLIKHDSPLDSGTNLLCELPQSYCEIVDYMSCNTHVQFEKIQ